MADQRMNKLASILINYSVAVKPGDLVRIWAFGSIHLALGSGYPQSGSKNKSAIHWDLLTDMRDGGRIIVDGELFYESGKFMI